MIDRLLVAPDVVMNNSILAPGNGRGGYKRALEMVFAAFSDVELTIDDLIAEGDLVAERWTIHGTHQGEFMGMRATNN
jgi:predicted ester cyclase